MEVVFQAHDFPFKGRDIPEDALADALEKAKLGEVTGGGSGRQTSAIDVEVTDFERGLKLIRRTLKKVGAPASTEIHRHRPKHEIYRLE
ncbi:MAG: hypothetical protein P4N60_03125 [Verrucomicrobiae bacterium]|nr:hypothetical protein [Verrucomicrobiae bacterium]